MLICQMAWVGLKGAAPYANPGEVSTGLSDRRERGKGATSHGSLVSEANETSMDATARERPSEA